MPQDQDEHNAYARSVTFWGSPALCDWLFASTCQKAPVVSDPLAGTPKSEP